MYVLLISGLFIINKFLSVKSNTGGFRGFSVSRRSGRSNQRHVQLPFARYCTSNVCLFVYMYVCMYM